MDKLRTFSDQRWQRCLETFLASLREQGQSRTVVTNCRNILCTFFQDRAPEAVLATDVEAFCRATSYHGVPSGGTVKRKRKAIREFYDVALACELYQGPNPARPRVVDKAAVPHLFDDSTWQKCFEHFLEDLYRRSQSKATIESYTGILRRFFQGKGDPAKITRADVSNFIQQPCASNGKQGQPAAIATINIRITVIRMFFDFASGYTIAGPDGDPVPLFTRANPCAGLRHGQPAQVYKSLSLPEIKAFFAVIPATIMGLRDRSFFWTALLTLRRRSEIAALCWGSISHGMITSEDGSSHEGIMYTFRGKGRQAILDCAELPQKAYEEICAYLQAAGRWDTMTPESPIWSAIGPDKGGNVRDREVRALTASTVAKRLKVYARASGIPESRFSLHSMRHTGAFLRKISGENLFSISHTLRHKSLDMTKKYLEGLTIATADTGATAVSARLAALGVT